MNKNTISIGCFGALRPLKNHLQQAIWAMMFADKIGKHLEFHINRSEFEKDESSPVLKNLHSLFSSTPHTLVEHPWVEHDEFLKLVKTMDLGLQMSFTETFNIVTADFVYCGVPIVVSDEIDWMNFLYKANPSISSQARTVLPKRLPQFITRKRCVSAATLFCASWSIIDMLIRY